MILPRINPLTKFPLSISPPGHASPQSPMVQVVEGHSVSIIGPVNVSKKYAVTPVSWLPTPYLNKAPRSLSLFSNIGGLRR